MKLIFLDVDGVLNSRAWLTRVGRFDDPDEMIDPEKVELLNELVSRTGAKIVVSSSWRLGHSDLSSLKELLCGRHKICDVIIGMTPSLWSDHQVRGDEIQAWMDEWVEDCGEPIEKFVILDDDSDMAHLWPYLIKTLFENGLQETHTETAEKKLNGE